MSRRRAARERRIARCLLVTGLLSVPGATAAIPIPNFAQTVEAIACQTYGKDVFNPSIELQGKRVLLGEPRAATCRNTVAWRLFVLPQRTEVGPLLVAVCDEKELPTKDLEWARQQHDRMAAAAADVPSGATPTDAEIAPYRASRNERIGDGRKVDFFHVLTIGHGVLTTPSLFLTDRRSHHTVVVQLDPDKLCEYKPTIELCTDPQAAMRKLALRVATTFAGGPNGTPAPDPSAAAPCRELDPYSRFDNALTSEGHKRHVQLLNAIGVGRGRARLVAFEEAMTADSAEAFARFFNRASDADIKRVVDRLNDAAKLDLGTRWWEPGS